MFSFYNEALRRMAEKTITVQTAQTYLDCILGKARFQVLKVKKCVVEIQLSDLVWHSVWNKYLKKSYLKNLSAFLFRWRKVRVIFWTNWKTTLIVTQSYAFFPALSQWWGYVYFHCVSIGSLKFLPLLWLAAITWLKMVFLCSIKHWRVIATARRNQTLSPKAREEHRQ